MKNKNKAIGSNQHKSVYKSAGLTTMPSIGTILLYVALILIALNIIVWGRVSVEGRILSPLAKIQPNIVFIKPALAQGNQIDTWVDDAASVYGKSKANYSKLKNILHCLLNYETKHNYGRGMGDGGLAGGILQFHESTWNRMRKQMIKAGLITDISSRFDDKDAIYTMAWALVQGRGKEWGPILRNDCNNYK